MKLKNDMSIKLYFELKKNEPGFSIYPLCIDTIEKNSGTVHNFDGRSGEITCVERTTNDTQALTIVENSLMIHGFSFQIFILYEKHVIHVYNMYH